jgi:uncharacterized delta-60 repeat protein
MCVLVAVVAAFSLAASGVAAPWDLDRSFGPVSYDVRGVSAPSSAGPVTSLNALRDGRYLGTSGEVPPDGPPDGALFAMRPLGEMDLTFGSGGKVDFAGQEVTRKVVAGGVLRQPGGKFVVWGGNPSGSPGLRLVRYARDGMVDRSFGSDGRVEVEQGQAGRVVTRSDGSLVGTLLTCDFSRQQEPGPPLPCKVTLYALTRDGAVDRTFGTDGVVPSILGSGTFAPEAQSLLAGVLATDRSGRIVIAAGSEPGSSTGYVHVFRYTANGRRDTGFGRDTGVLLIGPNPNESPADMLVQRNGKIVLVTNGEHGATVTRLTRNGARDRSFGSRGRISVGNVHLSALALQRNGKLVVAGTSKDRTAFALFRFTSDGRLDMGFGQRGRVFTDTDGNPGLREDAGPDNTKWVGDVVVDPDGKIVLAGGDGFPDRSPIVMRYKGGRSVLPPRPRYSIDVRGGGKRLQVGETIRVGLLDRFHGRRVDQNLVVCGIPSSDALSGCVEDMRTGDYRAIKLRHAGVIELRFYIRTSAGLTFFRTLRVHRR